MPILFSTEVKKDPAAKSKSKRAFGRQNWLSILLKNTQYDNNNDDDVQVCPGGLARQGEDAHLRIPRSGIRTAASAAFPKWLKSRRTRQREKSKKRQREKSFKYWKMENLCRITIWCENDMLR